MTSVASSELQHWLMRLEALDPRKIELGLQRASSVWQRMNCQLPGKVVAIAGTNGKGTTAAMVARLASLRGYRVGNYASPHILHFRERIRILDRFVNDTELVAAFNAVDHARKNTSLTYFEFTTLACGYLFAQAELDVCVMEIGLGGRLDAVNIFDADVSLVTNIGLDHIDWLGDDRNTIAREKAGIYRSDKPAIYTSADRPENIDTVVKEKNSVPIFAGCHFGIESGRFWWADPEDGCINTPVGNLVKKFSADNLAGALAILHSLGMNNAPTTQDVDELMSLSLPGRFQRERVGETRLIFDVAHNDDSAKLLAERLSIEGVAGITAVFGVMSDKDVSAIIQPLLPFVSDWILIKPETPRAAEYAEMECALAELNVAREKITRCHEISDLRGFLVQVNTAVVCGSFYTVADTMKEFGIDIE